MLLLVLRPPRATTSILALVALLTANVIADNLPAHKVDGGQAAIEAAGAAVPYSPDFTPIELSFAKL